MNHFRVPILTLILPVFCFLDANAESNVSIAAQETEAAVVPREATLRLVELPALEFEFEVSLACAGEAESLTLSVADAFTTLGKDKLRNHQSAVTRLTVPARQLTLAASDGFCIKNDATSASELLVAGFTTAHASLRCVGADGMSVQFASVPLRVRVRCVREPDEAQESSPNK